MLPLERLTETTPLRLTAALLDLLQELRCGHAHHLPVMADQGARTDSCVPNVRTAIERWGGRIRYGWLLYECSSLWITAEFHAVRETAVGLLVDETPKPASAEQHALFAPDEGYGSDFDFLRRPDPRRRRVYRPSVSRVGRVAEFKARGRGTADRRTGAADSLSEAIDSYLHLLAEVDSVFVPALRGNDCRDPAKMKQLYEPLGRAQRRLLRLVEAHEADRSRFVPAGSTSIVRR
jgi:hypothetical protein